jgi:OOP family OmpA-OmpF porin
MKRLLLSVALITSALVAENVNMQLFGSMIKSGNWKDSMRGAGGRINIRPFQNGLLFGLEGNRYGYVDYKNTASDMVSNVIFDVGYEFNPYSTLVPYAYAGYGYQTVGKPQPGFRSGQVGQLGVGARYEVLKYLDVVGEVKYLKDIKNKLDNWGLNLGIFVPFGERLKDAKDSDGDGVPDYLDQCPGTPKGAKVDPKGCPVDSDGDGVPDYKDQCPNTPKGVQVNENGCPLDSDGDGVPDSVDKCPNTPAGVKVDKNGCALDSDGDGVPDGIDQCPNTPAGTKVDAKGCPTIKLTKNKYGEITYKFEIHFPFNSAYISPKYYPTIKKFAEWLKAHPEYKAEIQGYTDNVGSKRYNLILSTRRARAVYLKLIKFGAPKDRLSYKGYGATHFIAPNNTPQGRALNRRVVAKIIPIKPNN